MSYDYKPESAFADVRAAAANGWERWNRDANGAQWYKRANSLPVIHGPDEDDETECEFSELDRND